MKTIACTDIGGPATCEVSIIGSTPEEMISNGWKHIEEAHPDLAEKIKSNPPEVNAKWQSEFAEKFAELPAD